MPTGEQICEKQLFNLVDQIEKVKVNEEEIASLMPSIYRKLEWLDKEDIIKRVVSLEFNRMIDYYKDNDDIEVVDENAPRERGKRGGRGEAEEGYTRFFINFGKTDELTPPQLIELVNKCVPGKVRIGRIDLRDNFSFFEVEEGEANRVMDSMNGFEVDGRRISVEPAQAKGEGGKVDVVLVEAVVEAMASETDGIAVEEAETAAGKVTVAADVPAVVTTNRSANSMRTLLVAGRNASNIQLIHNLSKKRGSFITDHASFIVYLQPENHSQSQIQR